MLNKQIDWDAELERALSRLIARKWHRKSRLAKRAFIRRIFHSGKAPSDDLEDTELEEEEYEGRSVDKNLAPETPFE